MTSPISDRCPICGRHYNRHKDPYPYGLDLSSLYCNCHRRSLTERLAGLIARFLDWLLDLLIALIIKLFTICKGWIKRKIL